MLASSFEDWRTIDLDLAGSGDGIAEPAAEIWTLRLQAGGQMIVQDRQMPMSELIQALAVKPELQVVVQPGDQVSLQEVISVMDQLRSAGARLAMGRSAP